MLTEDFNSTIKSQQKRCSDVLLVKGLEYATVEDRLHNFKAAAAMKGETPRAALAGMMAKHTISIYDMCSSQGEYVLEVWDEKITDHINYLLLLACIVQEESGREVPQDA